MSMQHQKNREDPDQLIHLDVTIHVPAGQVALATKGDQPLTLPAIATLYPLSDQLYRTLLAEQDRQQSPDMQTAATQHARFDIRRRASRQPHCSTQLSFPQQEEPQSCTTVVDQRFRALLVEQDRQQSPDMQTAAAQHESSDLRMASRQAHFSRQLLFPQQAVFQPSDERQEVAVQESSSTMICREGQVFSLNLSNFVNNRRMLGMYYDIWSKSTNGDTPDIRDVILRYSRPLDKIIVIDAVCTHVPITLRTATLEDAVWWLRRGIVLCDGIPHAYAKVLIVRLKRRIACIYFRERMLKEARQEIDEVIMDIAFMLKGCVDVGIADAYWLFAWITLFEVWGNESKLANASQDILHYARMALEIAQKLPNENLQKAYSGRIACSFACLKLLLASHSHFQDARAELEKEASELVNKTSQCTLAKGDQSLWCRVKLWLNHVCGEPLEQILSQIIAECCGIDRSNNVFTMLSVYHRDIEIALCNGGGSGGNGD